MCLGNNCRVQRFSLINLLFSFVLLLASPFVFADGVYWLNNNDGVQYADPSAACEAMRVMDEALAAAQYTYHDSRLTSTRVDPGLMAARCDIYVARQFNKDIYDAQHADYPNSWQYWGPIVFRHGECTAPAVFDQSTGTCKAPEEAKCAALAGTSKAFSKSGTAPDGYMSLVGKVAAPKTEGCFDGCMASTADQKCTTKVNGPYLCRGTAWFSGQSCDSVGTTPGVDPSSSSEYPDPQQTEDSKPCNYVTNPDGTQSCTSEKSKEKEGQACGTVSATGEKICVDTQPSKNGLSLETTVKTETDANGDKTTTKTDKATTTTCTAILTCTSTTTTVTTVVRPNGSTSSSCTGANCPDKTTNPDGDGDGLGDCAFGDCGEGDGEGGGGQDWYQKGDDTYQSVMSDFADKAADVPVVTSVKGFLDFAPAGACPRYSVQAWVFTIQLDQWCTTTIPWSLIAAVVIGTAAFIAFRIAFT